jgi:hypothetical protein
MIFVAVVVGVDKSAYVEAVPGGVIPRICRALIVMHVISSILLHQQQQRSMWWLLLFDVEAVTASSFVVDGKSREHLEWT